MNIIDLNPENENLYFCCLEDWSDEIKEAGNHKEHWYNIMKDKGLRVKLAHDDEGNIGGMIQYLPIEFSSFEGKDLYVILCIWVHGHKKGRGNFQKRGLGTALLKAAEEDIKLLGSKGVAAWGLSMPVFMRASWFKKHGYEVVDKSGMMRLLWKSFSKDVEKPVLIKQNKKPEIIPGKVNISVFRNGWCPAQNLVFERAKRASIEFGNQVVVNEYATMDRGVMKEWGISDALFIDEKEIRTGPPPSFKKIRKKIERKVNKLK
jgi:N-acetylglutamate synthase-like GNAT family acetyltransferase